MPAERPAPRHWRPCPHNRTPGGPNGLAEWLCPGATLVILGGMDDLIWATFLSAGSPRVSGRGEAPPPSSSPQPPSGQAEGTREREGKVVPPQAAFSMFLPPSGHTMAALGFCPCSHPVQGLSSRRSSEMPWPPDSTVRRSRALSLCSTPPPAHWEENRGAPRWCPTGPCEPLGCSSFHQGPICPSWGSAIGAPHPSPTPPSYVSAQSAPARGLERACLGHGAFLHPCTVQAALQ